MLDLDLMTQSSNQRQRFLKIPFGRKHLRDSRALTLERMNCLIYQRIVDLSRVTRTALKLARIRADEQMAPSCQQGKTLLARISNMVK